MYKYVAADVSEWSSAAWFKVQLCCGQILGGWGGGSVNASGMHGVKKVKLNNIKRNSFKERN